MAYRILLAFLFWGQVLKAQVFLPALSASQSKGVLHLDYQIFSTNSGNGSTSDYAVCPTTKTEFDKLFNTSYSSTTLFAKGKLNSMVLFDFDSYTDLSNAGVAIPNAGEYFALKVQGTFIPKESGTYTFAINGDDGADFSIDNTMVVSYYGPHGIAANTLGTYNGTYNMTAGRSYSFVLRMQDGASNEGLQFYWKPPSSSGSESGGYKKNWIQRPEEMLNDKLLDGSAADRAAPSAQYIKNLTGTNTDGVYWINLPVAGPTQIYCLMNSAVDGGGWMMMMKATTGATFNYDANYWTTSNTLSPAEYNRNNGDAKFNTMNYYPAKDLLALWPDITTQGGSLSVYGCWSWLQNNFNNGIRIAPINFWASVDRLFLGDANNFSGKGTMFSTQTSVRFYGFNYNNAAFVSAESQTKTRWGFAWNENNDPYKLFGESGLNEVSPDVSGGIGVKSGHLGSYSAGDYVACCDNFRGINRTARVEIYVR